MNKLFKINKATAPLQISRNLFYLGPIPRTHQKECAHELDDTALVFVGNKGLTIITGCSHSGIINICEYSKTIFDKKIISIIGGLHLLHSDEQSAKIIEYFKQEQINSIYPCHCTGLSVKCQMANSGLNIYEVGSGLELNIE